jgi:excisionase family DNA binding protein
VTDRLLTARAIADTLDVTPATVLRWTRQGDLPAVRLPSGQVRYPERRFEDWLAARTTPQGDVAKRPPHDAALAASSASPLALVARSGRRSAVRSSPPQKET